MKLFIAIPSKDTMYSHTAFSLIELVKYCTSRGIEVQTEISLGTLVCNQRENLAQKFIESNSDYLLWVDSDMTFPSDIVQRLLSHNKSVVACTYSTRAYPLKSVSFKSANDWESWVKPSEEPLVEVAATGMGLMLCDRSSLTNLAKPLFQIKWMNEYKSYLGEDMFFCKRLRDAGIQIFIDVEASSDVHHLGTFGYSFKALGN
jgi:hypothetical protein